ncbi:MAG: HAD hydrolase-like protein [Proteobacteria bacterium]|nr:HAD hydrolase-like protein [Pseudomonadota bacterium]MDA1301018.1 HAD hydrolase-like protein [Pseudomonadota bacterium]
MLGPYVCPHRFSEPCACKKESGYLYRQAAFEHGLDLSEAIVIGDTEGDLEAARNLGVPGCLVKTGWGVQADQSGAAVVGDNILTIARKVIGGELSWNQ